MFTNPGLAKNRNILLFLGFGLLRIGIRPLRRQGIQEFVPLLVRQGFRRVEFVALSLRCHGQFGRGLDAKFDGVLIDAEDFDGDPPIDDDAFIKFAGED